MHIPCRPATDTRLAGLLLGRDAETLTSNLIGYVIAETGGDVGRGARGRREPHGLGEIELSGIPSIITDSLTIRGVRWEYFTTLTTLGPCLNLNRAVFGPPEGHDAWIEEARAALVRTDEDDQLFELARRGRGVPNVEGLQPVIGRFAQVMGEAVESCAALAAAASSGRERVNARKRSAARCPAP